MSTIEITKTSQPVRDEYIALLEDIAISVGVTPENISKTLKAKRWQEAPELNYGKPASVKSSVKKEYPIDLDGKRPGRVFELEGSSDRNKTTSLIYLATLLGINWDETRPFLDRDDKVYRTAIEKVVAPLSKNQKAELQLKSENYELSIVISDGQATILLLDGNLNPISGFDNKSVPLKSPEDWQQYRDLMKQVCDVQFVGKSRDFIGQVWIEESKDLVLFCKEVRSNIGTLREYLSTLPRDQVYGRTEEELAAEIASVSTRLGELKEDIEGIIQRVSEHDNLIKESLELINLQRELKEDQTPALKKVLKYSRLVETAQDHNKRKQDLDRAISGLERDLEHEQRELERLEPSLTKIRSCLDDLRGKIVTKLKELSALDNHASQVLRYIANKEYDSLLAFCTYALVEKETVQLLEAILSASEKYSKGLIVPLDSVEKPGIKLDNLIKGWRTAKNMAEDIQYLNPELEAAYKAFESAHIHFAKDMRFLESSVDTTRNRVDDKGRLLEERQEELKITNKILQSLLGTEDLQAIRVQSDQITKLLSQDCQDKLRQVEILADSIGYTRPWQRDPSDLQTLIHNWQASNKRDEKKKREIEARERNLKEILHNLKRSSLRTSAGKPQPDALSELQNILGFTVDYLETYKLVREGETSQSVNLHKIKERLDEDFEKVRQALNRVIHKRCPIMYKNRASGPVRLSVESYDFLNSTQSVPELLEDAEWVGGGGDSAMTVYGLATRSSGSHIGTILLVDEFNDADTFKQFVCDDLADLPQLAFAIFVKQNPDLQESIFEVIK